MADDDKLSPADIAAAKARRLEAMALQEIEGNPLTLSDRLLFEMFEEEGWSHARRIAHLLERAAEAPPESGGPVPMPERPA